MPTKNTACDNFRRWRETLQQDPNGHIGERMGNYDIAAETRGITDQWGDVSFLQNGESAARICDILDIAR